MLKLIPCLLLLSIYSCKKIGPKRRIQGDLINIATNKGIPNKQINLYKRYQIPIVVGGIQRSKDLKTVYTDQNGHFDFGSPRFNYASIDPEAKIWVSQGNIDRHNIYAYSDFPPSLDSEIRDHYLYFKVLPFFRTLSIRIVKLSVISDNDSLYYKIYNKHLVEIGDSTNYISSYLIAKNGNFPKMYNLEHDGMGFIIFDIKKVKSGVISFHRDSIWLDEGDSKEYVLEY